MDFSAPTKKFHTNKRGELTLLTSEPVEFKK
jgi:hypothetical protein